jgi:hypothetical protein
MRNDDYNCDDNDKALALQVKEEGNAHFAAKRYGEAAKRYDVAVCHVRRSADGATEGEKVKKNKCMNNYCCVSSSATTCDCLLVVCLMSDEPPRHGCLLWYSSSFLRWTPSPGRPADR